MPGAEALSGLDRAYFQSLIELNSGFVSDTKGAQRETPKFLSFPDIPSDTKLFKIIQK